MKLSSIVLTIDDSHKAIVSCLEMGYFDVHIVNNAGTSIETHYCFNDWEVASFIPAFMRSKGVEIPDVEIGYLKTLIANIPQQLRRL